MKLSLRRLLTLFAAILFALATAPPSTAATTLVSFQFTTYVDATAVGGSPTTPLRITYQFDPALAPGSGGFGAGDNFASYGPLESMILEVGTECVAVRGDGTDITVFDDAGTTIVEDSYVVSAGEASLAGRTLFGGPLESFRILLADNERTMFSDTSLPTSNAFAEVADYQQTSVALRNPVNNRRIFLDAGDAPFQLSSIDLSGNIAELIGDVKALPTSSIVIEKLVAPLEKARTLTEGTLTQKSVKQAREALDEFRKLVRTNRNSLGQPAADQLTSSSQAISDQIPACGV